MKKSSAFGLRSAVPYVHTESMQVLTHPTSVFGHKALNFQNGKASNRRPAPNHSIKRTCLRQAAYVKR